MVFFFLPLLFLLLTGAQALAGPLPACPGPEALSLPSRLGDPPTETNLRALLLAARTVRDLPGRSAEGKLWLKRAGREVRTLLSLHPNDATLHALSGERYLLLVQYRGFPSGMPDGTKASAENDRALALDPNNVEAHLSKGIELYFKPWFVGGSVSRALSEFERANVLRPADPRILSWIGLARRKLGRPGGRKYLENALRICPASPLYLSRAQTFDPRAVHP